MPPSGYGSKQSDSVTEFLRCCLRDLVSENRGIRTADAAVEREICHINRDLRENRRGVVETKVLELTRAFYEQLLSEKTPDFDELVRFGDECLFKIDQGILDIHVLDK